MEPALSLAARTVHIKIHPTARTLSERREVLRVLERFGEVGMFRCLQYSRRAPVPNAFLSIFNTEAAAAAAVGSSPIRYRLIVEPAKLSPPITAFPGLGGRRSSSPVAATAEQKEKEKEKDRGESGVQAPATEAIKSEERVFEVRLSHSNFNHHTHLASPVTNPLHGPFLPVKPAHSYIAAALERLIPDSVASRGLRDWDTDSPRRVGGRVSGLDGEGEGEAGGNMGDGDLGSSGGLTLEQRVKSRERKRRKEKVMPRVMTGLKKLREEWEGKQIQKKHDGVKEGVD